MKNSENVIRIRPYTSPCGTLLLGSCHDRLCLCDWVESRHPGRTRRRLQSLLGAECVEADSHVVREAARQLDDYFAHGRTRFDLPLLWVGSDFQKKVWRKLWELTHHESIDGHTAEDEEKKHLIYYTDFAELCSNKAGVRAVAHAIGLNPVSVMIPCHLVIPKETIDRITEIQKKAEETIFKGDDLCISSILSDPTTNFGKYALGRELKRELILKEFE